MIADLNNCDPPSSQLSRLPFHALAFTLHWPGRRACFLVPRRQRIGLLHR